jgi:arylsulfatase
MPQRVVGSALLAVALGCDGSGAGGAASAALTGPAHNVIVISVDTLRADGLGVYGGPAGASPILDGLARRSLVFERAYSPATLTHPALSSMLTGLFPLRHGVGAQDGALHASVAPLAELLSARGVETASFVANLCKLQEVEHTVFSTGWETAMCGLDLEIEQYLWDAAVVDAAIAWLDQRPPRPRPWFVWVHLMDPHAEHRPPPAQWDYAARPVQAKYEQYEAFAADEQARALPGDERLRELLELYAAEIRGVDATLGRLLAALDRREDRGRTALIFTADHGEELFETWSRYDHGMSLTEGVLWVPLWVQAPGLAPGRSDAVVELLQVTPTVLELFGVDAPYDLDGVSLLAADPSPRDFALSAVSNITLSLRDGQHRYWLRRLDQPYERPPEEAPWRADAPWFREKECLARYPGPSRTAVEWLDLEAEQGLRLRLNRALKDYLERLGPLVQSTRIEDEELRAELDELGYVDGE